MNLLTTKELSDKLNVHPETIRRMVKRGQIPFIKLSEKEFRFNLENVIKALEEGAQWLHFP